MSFLRNNNSQGKYKFMIQSENILILNKISNPKLKALKTVIFTMSIYDWIECKTDKS